MAGLEDAALSGELFRQHSGASGARSSHDEHDHEGDTHQATDDEESLGLVSASRAVRQGGSAPAPAPTMRASRPYAESPRRAGAPQTGPKGVVEDQRAAVAAAAQAQRDAVRSTRAAQERSAITAPTVHEEEATRKLAAQLADASLDDERARWRAARLDELRSAAGQERGLREVGKESFVGAVERRGWVVVLIYEPDIARCQELLASTVALARGLPGNLAEPVALVRARASQLAFSLLPAQPRPHGDNYDDDEDEEEALPDPDVLPTMLVYRDGELERTWVRVDFDLRDDGVEGLLRREGILRETKGSGYEDDEDEDED